MRITETGRKLQHPIYHEVFGQEMMVNRVPVDPEQLQDYQDDCYHKQTALEDRFYIMQTLYISKGLDLSR